MTPVFSLRLWLGRRNPFPRRPPSAPTSNTLVADILRRLRHMQPSGEAQAIIVTRSTSCPALSREVASEVSTEVAPEIA